MAHTDTATTREARPAEADFVPHERTYFGFVHMAAWFAIHTAIILFGLLLLGVEDMTVTGVLVILAGVIALGYGVGSTARAAAKGRAKKQAFLEEVARSH